MSKFFRKVQEAAGLQQATSDPEPVAKSKEEVKQVKTIHTRIHTVSSKFSQEIEKSGQTKLHSTFADWSALEKGKTMPSKIAPVLETLATMQNGLDSLHCALASHLQEDLVSPFRKFVEVDCRGAMALASKQEDARLDYDIQLNAFKAVEKKSGAKHEEKKKAAEAAMNLAAAKYEQLNEEVVNQSQQLNVASQILLQQHALQYIKALEHHFNHGKQMMDKLVDFTQELEVNVAQMKEASAEMLRQQQEQHAANMAAQAEMQAAQEAGGDVVPPPYSPEAAGPPGYDQPPPGYDQPPPGYDQPPPGYNQPATDYPPPGSAPPSSYDQPPPAFDSSAPPPDYGAPPPGYDSGAPPPGYDSAPPPGYDSAPPPGYDSAAPPPSYDGSAPPAY
eukprot:TRINITY_DN719_c0_g1_i3.p1 TRINITY_DN719_c0_g1~~TRINITY_DN719_c0_g1_i3.p1  ORF type:complete len:407 (-),score=106.50 TRINITY_DN719_c0_g1_i3:306-1475(-)